MSDTNISNGWFTESEVLWPGQRFSLAVEDVLLQKRSKYQDILVFQSKTYGRVLVLDGVIQLTERDEYAYQEMLVHVPMFSHSNPKKVCIIGGGDGGMLREVCRHPGVEKIVMCEIDQDVVEVSKEYFGNTMATAFDDPRVTLLFDDGAKYLRESTEGFDIIIVDSSDPVGPAETLYEKEFYVTLRQALAPGGIVCTQGECMWLHLDLIKGLVEQGEKLFGAVKYGYLTIPTYPSGQIGLLTCCESADTDITTPVRPIGAELQGQLRYYNQEIHNAAFVLPSFAQRKIGSQVEKGTMCELPKSVAQLQTRLRRVNVLALTASAVAAGFLIGAALFRR